MLRIDPSWSLLKLGQVHSPRQVAELMQAHGLHASKALGQNFVADANTVTRIARMAAIKEGDHVIEIGPGLGSLTLALADAGARVTAIEIDRHLIEPLRTVVSDRDVSIINADALTVDWAEIVGDKPAIVVANLPYNVGTRIVVHILENVPSVTRLIVMLQREVGERLVARVGDAQYGALSVKARYYSEPSILGLVPPTVFIPKPDVDSAIVELKRREQPPTDADVQKMFELVRTGFSQRRKMLRKVLSSLVTNEQFECAGIAPTARAEELSVEDWGRLTNCSSAA